MLSLRGKKSSKSQVNADRELQKLTRQDLLQLLLDQMRDSDRLRDELAAAKENDADLNAFVDRLKAKLDDKDAQIARLRVKLDEKDVLLKQVLMHAREIAEEDHAQAVGTLEHIENLVTAHFLGHIDEQMANRVEVEPVEIEAEPVEIAAESEPEPEIAVEASTPQIADSAETTEESAADPAPSSEAEPAEIAPAPVQVRIVDELDQALPPVAAIPTLGFIDVETDHAPTHMGSRAAL